MGFTTVLDPRSDQQQETTDAGADVGALAGKRVGFRVDILWRSWDWVADEWAKLVEEQGGTAVTWRARGRTGKEGDEVLAELARFADEIDVAVVGLGNCGSCTNWTIHDALFTANHGVTTSAVATAHFEPLARALAKRGGRSGLRLQVLPYPLDTRPEDEVREIAREHFPALLATLGANV